MIKSIFLKSRKQISEKFDKDRLKSHLAGLHQHFSNEQVEKFHGYLTALAAAMMIQTHSFGSKKRRRCICLVTLNFTQYGTI